MEHVGQKERWSSLFYLEMLCGERQQKNRYQNKNYIYDIFPIVLLAHQYQNYVFLIFTWRCDMERNNKKKLGPSLKLYDIFPIALLAHQYHDYGFED